MRCREYKSYRRTSHLLPRGISENQPEGSSSNLCGEDLPVPGSEALIFNAPVFPLNTVLHPTNTGMLNVFEPRYLEMFGDLERDTAPGKSASFVHILSGSSAPEAAMEDSIGGVMRVGVLCTVLRIEKTPDGRMLVEYEGGRRVSVVSVFQSSPYMIAAFEWFGDEDPEDGAQQKEVLALEKEVWKTLLEIEQLMKKLGSSKDSGPSLPPGLGKYSPSLDPSMSSVDYLIQSGSRAGHSISQWMRAGTATGGSAKSRSGSANSPMDPYEAVRDSMHPQRSELFSFAAASLLEMGVPERIALLRSQDTGARLQWVRAATEPYLQELRAKQALNRTFGDE